MGITNSNKTIDQQIIGCSDSLIVTLAISAAPDIVSAPVDLVLALDNSASMAGEAFATLQAAANQIIDIIDGATGDIDGIIENSRVGIVSFDSVATIESPLDTNAVLLRQIVNNLTTEEAGSTNHYDAFSKAISLFNTTSENEKVLVMLTDGVDSEGTSADNIARYARETLGITIYMVGIEGTEGIDINNLNEWATDPDESHVIIAPDTESIEALLGELGANITKAGATDIQILDTVNPDFEITQIVSPTVGTATLVTPQSVAWAIDSLGTEADEGATLQFYVQHTAITGGTKAVNEAITYSDAEENIVDFPDPLVTVQCSDIVEYSEPCPASVDVTTENCQDIIAFDMSNVTIDGKGRIAEVSLTLLNVCPGKRVAVAVFLSELDEEGLEYPRGRKIFTLPALTGTECQNVQINCIKFVLPEDLDLGGAPDTLCSARTFRARAFANIIDYDYFPCCEG